MANNRRFVNEPDMAGLNSFLEKNMTIVTRYLTEVYVSLSLNSGMFKSSFDIILLRRSHRNSIPATASGHALMTRMSLYCIDS